MTIKTCLLILASSCAALVAQANVKFSESWADKLQGYRDFGETTYEVVSSGKFSARGVVSFGSEDPSIPGIVENLNEDSSVSIQIGDWSADATLGDDQRFVPGQSRSVRLPLANGGLVKIAWTQKAITWSVTAKTGTAKSGEDLETSPLASGLVTGESYRIFPEDGNAAGCFLTLDDLSASADIPVAGSAKYKIKTIGSGDFAEEFELNSVKIKGKAIIQRD